MKVKVTDDCIACGLCENVCPQVFKVQAVSEVIGDPDSYPEQTQEAAAVCPVNAIELAQ